MFKKIKKSEKGFTLVELVVVIAILAILAALLVPRIIGSVDEARKASELSKARTVAGEVAIYNAKEMVKSGGGSPIVSTTINATHITTLGLDSSALPDSNIVEVVVDSAGNAKVVEKP